MTKYIKYAFMSLLLVLVTSCDKEEPGMTSTVNVAGEWMLTWDYVDPDGVVENDIFGGELLCLTYNTNADNGKEIWFKCTYKNFPLLIKTACDAANYTFGGTYDPAATPDDAIFDGKIIPGGAVSPLGHVADKFECIMTLDGDVAGEYYIVHGWRRTGFDDGAE